MTVQPISLDTARTFVRAWHRHSKPPQGHLFSLGLFGDDLTLHGVAIVGRPVAKALQSRGWAEVTRLCTDGTRNACSRLYGAACREARRRGYPVVCTYTRADETGTSLRAAGFVAAARVRGRQWDTPTRRREPGDGTDKIRWERAA